MIINNENKENVDTRKEYLEILKEAGLFYRLQIGLMFSQFTIYLVSNGYLLQIINKSENNLVSFGVSMLGIFLSITAIIICKRCKLYMDSLKRRIVEYEIKVDITPLAINENKSYLRPSSILIAFFACGSLFWIIYLSKIFFIK